MALAGARTGASDHEDASAVGRSRNCVYFGVNHLSVSTYYNIYIVIDVNDNVIYL